MAKKGGKKGKGNKGKSGGGGGAAKKGVDVKNIVSPGHAVEDRILYGDGEAGAAATQDAPEAAVATASTTSTNVPSSAPETVAAPSGQQEEVSKTQESETSLAESEEEPTTAEKTAAGGAAVAGVAGTAVAGESVKDTEAAAPATEEVVLAETKEVAPVETTAANESLAAPTSEDLSRQVPTEELESSRSKEAALAESALAGGAVTTVAATTLAERPKSKEAQGSEETAGSAAAVESSTVEPHAKRPYETSPLIQDETKPYKMPKVDDSADVAAPAKANGVLQDGMPGTYPGTPSGQDSSAAAVSALPGGNAVQSIPETKTANVSEIQEDYEKHTAAGTELSTAGVAAAGAPLEVPGLESGETSKDLEREPTTQSSATGATESQDTSTNGLPIAAAATGGTAEAVAAAAAAATLPEDNKESEPEAQKVTEPAASPAVAVTKAEVPDFSTATATVPVETSNAEAEPQPITEPAAAVTKEQAPGSVANGTPSTPIPALIASEDKSATLAPSSAAPAGLQSQEAAGQATTTGPVSGETKPTADAAARDASLDGKKSGGEAPDVSHLQSTIAQAQEKAAELENKTAELEKRRKGGLFGWLKRKIKGDKA